MIFLDVDGVLNGFRCMQFGYSEQQQKSGEVIVSEAEGTSVAVESVLVSHLRKLV